MSKLNSKYELGGLSKDVIGLPLTMLNLPNTIEVEGVTLTLKNAFHVSLICIGKIIEKYAVQDSNFRSSVIDDFVDYTSQCEIGLIKIKNDFRFVTAAEHRSVIVMCDISNLHGFFNLLNQKYVLNVEYPPTHVTLYTLQPEKGIFVTDSNDLIKLTKLIPSPVSLPSLL